jgi:hypothetical protein
MKTPILVLSLLLVVATEASAECAPKKVLRIVSQVESPDIPPGSFASLPKTVYRLGAKYLRVEELPDPANKIQGLVISSAPDNWIVNLADHTGRHIVDPDPNGKVLVPLFPPGSFGGLPKELSGIEMGCEAAFFDSLKSPKRVLKGQGIEKVQQAVGTQDWKLVLVRTSTSSPPEMLFVFKGDDIVYAVRYLSYEELPEIDMKLFSKPEGIEFTAAPAG